MTLSAVLTVTCACALAPSARAAPLTAEGYAGLDTVHQALETVDDDATDLAAALAPAIKACDQLSTADPLLKAARRQCRSVFRLLLTDDPTCPNRDHCLKQFQDVRRLTQTVIVDSRTLNRAIATRVGTERCRRFLRADAKEIQGFSRLVRAYRRVESALFSKSESRLRSALRKLDAVPTPGSGSDDTGDRRFRVECASG